MFGIWDKAKTSVKDGGVYYKVYAPHATNVAVLINDLKAISMKKDSDGIWSCIDDKGSRNDTYNFLINSTLKIDPLAPYNTPQDESAPASIQYKSTHEWSDQTWMTKRAQRDWGKEALLIAEIHPGSWGEEATYRSLANNLPEYLSKTGYNAVQFMPVQEHFLESSWGYLASSWFAPASRYGTPDDLKYLIDKLHEKDIAVIFDWLVFHFPSDAMGLVDFDGTNLFASKSGVPNLAQDLWGSNPFDITDPVIRDFLKSSLNYWLKEFHFDGVRFDAITDLLYLSMGLPWSMNPTEFNIDFDEEVKQRAKLGSPGIEFLRDLTTHVHSNYPGVLLLGEDSSDYVGTSKTKEMDPDYWLGFDKKYVLSTSYMAIKDYFSVPETERSTDLLNSALQMAEDQRRVYQISHDEVTQLTKGSLYRTLHVDDERLRVDFYKCFLMFYFCFPGKKMFFNGIEWGNYNAWNGDNEYHEAHPSDKSTKYIYPSEIFDREDQGNIHKFFSELAAIYLHTADLYEQDEYGPPWIVSMENNTAIFQRGKIFCVFNFSETERKIYLPNKKDWKLIKSSTDKNVEVEIDNVTLPPVSGCYIT